MGLKVWYLLFTYLMLFYSENAFAEMYHPMNFIDQGPNTLVSNNDAILSLPSQEGIEIRKIDKIDQIDKIGIFIKTNSINISSNPAGAEIWIDGVNTGKVTPDVMNFDIAGSHDFELRLNGYEIYQENIQISGYMTKEVILVRSRIASIKPALTIDESVIQKIGQDKIARERTYDWGSVLLNFVVQINSTPSGAEIWVDGINTGKFTPDSIFTSAGTHNFELLLAGYEVYQENISVSGSMTREIILKRLLLVRSAILYDSKIFNIEQLQISNGVSVRLASFDNQSNSYDNLTRTVAYSILMPRMNVVLDSIPQGAKAKIITKYGEIDRTTPAKITLPDGINPYELNLEGYLPYKGNFEVSFEDDNNSISIKGDGVSTTVSGKSLASQINSEIDVATITPRLIPLSASSDEVTGTRGVDQPEPSGVTMQPESGGSTDTKNEIKNNVSYQETNTSMYIHVNSFPQGAQIWIDGQYTQKLTPDKIYFDASGTHTLKLILTGYQIYEESIRISESGPKEVTLIPVNTVSPTEPSQSVPGFPALVLLLAIVLVRSMFYNR